MSELLIGIAADYFQLLLNSFHSPVAMGVLAGILQLWGYQLYLRISHIEPNPLTWLMFGYGTAILTILEWEKDANLPELFLPVICSVLGWWVMIKAWRHALRTQPIRRRGLRRFWPDAFWPDDKWQRWSFTTDLGVTAAYLAMLGMAYLQADNFTSIGDLLASDNAWILAFLILSNLTVFSEFYPLIKETWDKPEKEHWSPWFVWTLAYAALIWTSYLYHGWSSWILMYPVLNTLMHGVVAIVALRKPQDTKRVLKKA